jgi:hypothetical protein
VSLASTLPDPACGLGFTTEQIDGLFGEDSDTRRSFDAFMHGQTVALCDGQPPCERAHGPICYVSDVRRFIHGLPPLD